MEKSGLKFLKNNTFPRGLLGVLTTIALVLEVKAEASSAGSKAQSAEEVTPPTFFCKKYTNDIKSGRKVNTSMEVIKKST